MIIDVAGASPAHQRYNKRRERDGTWTVFNIFCHEPANLGRGLSIGMVETDAVKLVDSLNRLHPWNDGGTIHQIRRRVVARTPTVLFLSHDGRSSLSERRP